MGVHRFVFDDVQLDDTYQHKSIKTRHSYNDYSPVCKSSELFGEVQLHLLAVVPTTDVIPRIFVTLLTKAHVRARNKTLQWKNRQHK